MTPPTEETTRELHIPCGADNRIDEVVVFPRQAHVTRRVQIEAEHGLHRLAIEIQAFEVDAGSVQAKVFGAGEILSVQLQQIPTHEIAQPALKALVEEQIELTQRKETLEAERRNLQRQGRLLDGIADFAAVEVPKEIKTALPAPSALGELMNYLDSQGERIAGRELDLSRQIKAVERQMEALQRGLSELNREQRRERRVIEVLFRSEHPQSLAVEAGYVVAHAEWEPVYKVDIPTALDALNLTQLALIRQRSGEDWRQVRLTLSNAAPMQGGALPEPQSWRLYNAPPPPPAPALFGKVAPAPAAEPTPFDDEVMAEELSTTLTGLEAPEAAFAEADAQESGISFEYRLPSRIDLPSGPRESLLPLFTRTPPAEFFHYTVPRLESQVYLVARIRPDRALLAGSMNIHFGGRFVGSTRLAELEPGAELLANLGADRGVRALRKKVTDHKEETFFGKVDRQTVVRELRYAIELENLKETPVRVQVVDALPTPATDRFQITALELHPEPSERAWRRREGVTAWMLEIPPGEGRAITIGFNLKHPKGEPPLGL